MKHLLIGLLIAASVVVACPAFGQTETPTETNTPTVTPTATNTGTATNTATVTQTRTATNTPTRTAGAANACCQCSGSKCVAPSGGSCGSCTLVWGALCDTDTGQCGTATPTVKPTNTNVETRTPTDTPTARAATSTKTATITPTETPTAAFSPFASNHYPAQPIKGYTYWVSKSDAGAMLQPKANNRYCLTSVSIDYIPAAAPTPGAHVALTDNGTVMFQATSSVSIDLGAQPGGGPCVIGPVTIVNTGTGTFEVTIGYFERGQTLAATGGP